MFRKPFSSSDRKSREVALPIAIIEHLQPTIKFAPAFADLFRAAIRLTTIRLIRPPDFYSYWLDGRCYPRAYARTILRLLDGLSRVRSIPSLATLELRDCPFAYMREDDGEINQALASQAMRKFTRLELAPLRLHFPTWGGIPSQRRETAMDLLDIFKNASHLKVLRLSAGYDQFLRNFITSATQFEHLVQIEFGLLHTDAPVFGPFIAKNLPQLEVLIIVEGHVNEPGSWTDVFKVWRQRKSEMLAQGQPLKLVVLQLVRLFDGGRAVPVREIAGLTYQLCTTQYAHLLFALVNTDVNTHTAKK